MGDCGGSYELRMENGKGRMEEGRKRQKGLRYENKG
jgi:hypothetical protein